MKSHKIQFECVNVHSKWPPSISIQSCKHSGHLAINLTIISKGSFAVFSIILHFSDSEFGWRFSHASGFKMSHNSQSGRFKSGLSDVQSSARINAVTLRAILDNFLLVSCCWILWEDLALLLEQVSLCGFTACSTVTLTPGMQKWITVVPFPDNLQHTITKDGWWPLWTLGTFALATYNVWAYTLSFCLLNFYSMVKIFSSVNKILLNKCLL